MSESPDPDSFRPDIPWFKVLGGIAVVAVVIGAVGWLSGAGWFGWRQFAYGDIELFVVNFGDETRIVDVARHGTVEVEPESYEIADVVGGPQHVLVRDDQGQTVETHEFRAEKSDALVRVGGEACLAVVDITPMYAGADDPEPVGGETFRIVDGLRKSRTTYVPGSRNVVWPRQSFPPQLDETRGPGIWIEKVGCGHLEDPATLETYLKVRLEDRLGRDSGRGNAPPEPPGSPPGQ